MSKLSPPRPLVGNFFKVLRASKLFVRDVFSEAANIMTSSSSRIWKGGKENEEGGGRKKKEKKKEKEKKEKKEKEEEREEERGRGREK